MTDPTIIEAAARALIAAEEWDEHEVEHLSRAVVAAVTPLIRAAALEEAAQNFERYETEIGSGVAAAIRAWKEQP